MSDTIKQNLEARYLDLVTGLKRYSDNPDIELIDAAWEYTKRIHKYNSFKSGEPHIQHLVKVAEILVDWKMDSVTIASGLLHGVLDTTDYKYSEIEKKFGTQVAQIVNGVSKVRNIGFEKNKNDQYAENLRKLLLVLAKDLRVVFVYLAGKLHQIQTIGYLTKNEQKIIARESLQLHAPISERLGMGDLKGQFEDLAFPVLYEEQYEKVKELSYKHYNHAEIHSNKMKRELLKKLAEHNIRAEINSRKKRLYSLWKKLERDSIDWDFEKVMDIVALRIKVGTVQECYKSLSIVHELYQPVQNIELSDFIFQPKPNGYRSLHTKVIGLGERKVEVQIRTHKMHEQAEYGLAAHWIYSNAKQSGMKDENLEEGEYTPQKNKISWTKQLVKWQQEVKDSEDFEEAVKFDALDDRMFVLSPEGDIFELPVGSTPVDFAYAVHTDLANYIGGAKVNGELVQLDHQLESGDVIEILKKKQFTRPKQHWLEFVRSNHAREMIEKSLRRSLKG